LKQGWSTENKQFGFLIGASDNMGLKKSRSYDQYTMLLLMYYSVDLLIENKLYPDPKLAPQEAWEKCYSHVGKDWEEEKDNYTFTISTEDAKMIASEVTLPSIELILEMLQNGMSMNGMICPLYQKITNLLSCTQYAKPGKFLNARILHGWILHKVS